VRPRRKGSMSQTGARRETLDLLGVSMPEIRLRHCAHTHDMVIHSSQDIVEISTPHPLYPSFTLTIEPG
jgi:hypothetical protein